MARKKSTIRKIHEGTFCLDRKSNSLSRTQLTEVDFPPILIDDAKEQFKQLAETVNKMGVLYPGDIWLLAILANDLVFYSRVSDIIQKEGMTHTDNRGVARSHPVTRMHKNLSERILKMCSEFGLTPVSRLKLDVNMKQLVVQESRVSIR